jgi:hypothetical protein
MEERPLTDLVKTLRDSDIKYIYYVIALNIAGVAFSINQTKDAVYNEYHILLVVAVAFWAMGVFLGFQFLFRFKDSLQYTINGSQIANDILKAKTDILNKEEVSQMAFNDFDTKSVNVQIKARRLYRGSLIVFYLGSLVFVTWHITNMILINKPAIATYDTNEKQFENSNSKTISLKKKITNKTQIR